MTIESGNPLQGTAEWLRERAGHLTGSQAHAVFARSKTTGKPLKARQDLIDKLVAERATGEAITTPVTWAMQWGTDHEEEARHAYERLTGRSVGITGFVRHPSVAWLGASPDGLVGTDGLVEIKCPQTITHLRRWRDQQIPEEYRDQMLVELLCTGRRWCDYVDYDPRLVGKLDDQAMLIIRYEPSAEEREAGLKACEKFLAEVQAEYTDLVLPV